MFSKEPCDELLDFLKRENTNIKHSVCKTFINVYRRMNNENFKTFLLLPWFSTMDDDVIVFVFSTSFLF